MKPKKEGWKTYAPIVIIRYWIFQGILYMNWVERFHRLLLEFGFFLLIYLLGSKFASNRIIVSVFIAHTLSAVFNGHLVAMCVHDLFWFSLYKDRQKFFHYIEKCRLRLLRKSPKYLSGAVFFGSLTYGFFKDTSDLDIRFIPENGFWNAFRTANLVFVERWNALWAGFPLDAYMFRTKAEIHEKMDVMMEIPVVVYRYGNRLDEVLDRSETFESFRSDFFQKTNEVQVL
jgi:hypothetical protein